MRFSNGPLIGLDVGASLLKAVRLKRRGDKVLVEQAGLAVMPGGALSEGVLLDPPAVACCIRELCRRPGLGGRRAAVAIGGTDVFLTRLKLPRGDEKALPSLVAEETARLLPFPREEASVDFQVLEALGYGPWVEAMVAAARRQKIDQLRQVLRRAGKTVVLIEPAAYSLSNAFEFNYEPAPEQIAALIDIGTTSATVCILRGATPLLARELSLARGQLSEQEWGLADRVAVQLERVLIEMDEIADDRPMEPRSGQIEKLWLSGGGARIAGLEETLFERFRLPMEEMNPFRRLEWLGTDALARLVTDHAHCMGVAVGLALRGLDDSPS